MALGAAIGGVFGKYLFQLIKEASANLNRVGAIQASCLLAVTIGTLLYTIFKNKIKTYKIASKIVCVIVGFALGMMSSFLGIGGGPINLVVFFFFFSMDTKTAAENSLYTIFFSQIASLIYSIVSGSVPAFSFGMLALMAGSGICGGICGRCINKKIESVVLDRLFIALMVFLIFINIYNIYQFL